MLKTLALGSLVTTLALAAPAAAQLVPTAAPPLPAGLYSDLDLGGGESVEALPAAESLITGPSAAESVGSFPVEEPQFKPFLSGISGGELAWQNDCPPITESTGTWIRRGLWYVDLDAVVMTRTWDNDGVTLIQESRASFLDRHRRLDESSPGADGSVRLALGRFLFRDQQNRDHTAEMVVFGGAEWVDQGSIAASGTSTLLVPNALNKNGTLTSFSRASESSYTYSSHFNSFEWNYGVTQRMGRDRMELQPSGEWVRKASSGWTKNYLAGLRYFEMQGDLDWFATDIASIDDDTDGSYIIRTSNNMFGVQLGVGTTYETDRWNVSLMSKHGMYVNDARSTADLTFTDLPVGNASGFTNEGHENSLAYLLQFGITGRYHLRPNLSLRVGYELMYITGLAFAPNEISFDANETLAGISGDAFFRGFTFGSEYYW